MLASQAVERKHAKGLGMYKDARTVFMSLFWDDFRHLLKYALIVCALCAVAVLSLIGVLVFQPHQRAYAITSVALCVLALVGMCSFAVYQCVFYYERMYEDRAFFYNAVPLSIPEIIKEKFCVITVIQLLVEFVVLLFGMLLYSVLCFKVPTETGEIVNMIQAELPFLGFAPLGNMIVFALYAIGNAICTAFLIIGTVTIARLGFLRKFPILGCIVGFIIVLMLSYCLGVVVTCLPITANIPIVLTDDGTVSSAQAIGNAYLAFGKIDIVQLLSAASFSSSAITANMMLVNDGANLINRAPMGGVIFEPLIYMAGTYFFARLAQKTYQVSR